MMISLPKSAALSAVSQIVPNAVRIAVPSVTVKVDEYILQPPKSAITHYTLSKQLPKHAVAVTSGLTSGTQVRLAHTDVQIPDFSSYRRDGVRKSSESSQTTAVPRRAFTYMIVGVGSVSGVYAAKTVVNQFIATWSPSADVLALAKIEIKLSDIPEGKNAIFKWRGKPLFVRHRSAEEIAREEAVDISTLRDAEHDKDRVINPQWLVTIGVCTHLGCVPISNAGDYGGYYCPCHGSHYDSSGRIRKGPAPLNLEVPAYEFPDEDTLLVG